jgi:DNA-binding MarR family transcriptional regulator
LTIAPPDRAGGVLARKRKRPPASSRKLDRALPQIFVDAMKNGLPQRDARDKRKVWTMVMRIAMSAFLRGWTEMQFITEMTKCEKHKTRQDHQLWAQLRRGSSDRAACKDLQRAWDAAVVNANNVGNRTRAEIRADAIERAYRWADRITEGYDGLRPSHAAVMGYVISETERRGMLRVSCPARDVAEYAKLPVTTTHRTLDVLTTKGLLVRESRGRSGKPGNRRAAIYSLADPHDVPLSCPGSPGAAPRSRTGT